MAIFHSHHKANKHMVAYKVVVDELSKLFEGFEVQHIPQTENEEADALLRMGSTRKNFRMVLS